MMLATWALSPPAAGAGAPAWRAEATFRGLTLTAALQELQARGLPVVFSSSLVRDSMRVEAEPRGSTLRELLDELLAPHGLRAQVGARGRLVVVAAPPVEPRRDAPVPGGPDPPPIFAAEIVVTPGPEASGEPVGPRSLAPAEAAERPHLGGDVFRAMGALPGTAMRETSSRLHVRGGRDDDLLILLDGLELLAPYHLQEFDSALSIVAPTTLARAELIPSGYPAEYGDRMGGVLDLTTETPSQPRHLALGVGLLYAEAAVSGRSGADRGAWYGSARGGSYRLALELAGRRANPHFWDAFAKVDYGLGSAHSLRLSTLVAQDEFRLGASAPEGEAYGSRWSNGYAWATHHGLFGSALAVETIASDGEIERRRDASSAQFGDRFEVEDFRTLEIAGLKQIWRYEPRRRFTLEAGFEVRQLGSTVEYRNERQLEGALASLRARPGTGATSFLGRFDFDQSAVFLSGVMRPLDSLTAEVGLRHDRDSLTEEDHVSPRFNLAWAPRPSTTVRAAWGWFYQSQRPNELQVEDDETELQRAERSEHRVLELERRFPSGASLRVEAFEQRISRSRARFDNLFDPVTIFPELEEDRVRIAPARGLAEGLEVGYRSARRGPVAWRLSYTLSTARESIGGRPVRRAIDQPHAINAGLSYRAPRGWTVDAAWLYHTGWPTTAVSARAVMAPDGAIVLEPVLGPLNAERLPPYHRLDVRVSRSWDLAGGRLSAYVDLQNLYDRNNVRGSTDFAVDLDADGRVRVHSQVVTWGGLLPSFGIRWSR